MYIHVSTEIILGIRIILGKLRLPNSSFLIMVLRGHAHNNPLRLRHFLVPVGCPGVTSPHLSFDMGVYLDWQGGKVEVFFVTVTIAKNLSGYYLTYLKMVG